MEVIDKLAENHVSLCRLFVCSCEDCLNCKSQHGNFGAFGESQRVGELFGRLLEKEYPKIMSEEFTISLDDLLSWSYWPDFIKIYSK